MPAAVAREQLKGALGDYLRQRGLPLQKAFRCLNPEHEDKHPSMRYYERAGNVHCFACGATYDLFDLLGMDYGLSGFRAQRDKAAELFGGGVEERPAKELRGATTSPVTADRSVEMSALRAGADDDVSYFTGRGITAESIGRHGLFQLEGRAYFPVVEGGICTGWCARALREDREPRYRNSTGPLGLWNGDLLARDGGGAWLYVTEGIVDALCLEQMGHAAIALCGSQNTAKLVERCRASRAAATWRFVACGDPDSAGRRMNEALCKGLEGLGLSCSALALEPEDGDVNSLYRRDRARLTDLLQATQASQADAAGGSVAAGLEGFLEETRRQRSALSTGLPALDKVLDGGLHPGLYVLGSVSSLGKTSFALQLADHVAATAGDVLFFSLEQSRGELAAKSLSRTSARMDKTGRGLTARQILSGAWAEGAKARLLEEAGAAYAKGAGRLFVREGMGDIGTEEIAAALEAHRAQRGCVPAVFVDYLQILKPSDPRATDKQNTDRAVVALKRLSRDFATPVFALSSFNRENYRAAVSMEAFKESGAVEYSSDVLLGIQAARAGEKDFDINKAKAREPRHLELVMLKNRNGIPYARIPLRYYAKYSLFAEA